MTAPITKFKSTAKEPWQLEYTDAAGRTKTYSIPAIIPVDLLRLSIEQRRVNALKGQTKAQKTAAIQDLGTQMIFLFKDQVLPSEFPLHTPDAEPLFEMWAQYVDLGKAPSSAD